MGSTPAPSALRILHVTPFFADPGLGGIARASAGLARAQAARGHAVTVLTVARAPGLSEAVEHGVRVVRLPAVGPRLLPFGRGAAGMLAREVPGADVVHVHGVRHGLALGVPAACRRAGRPYVLQPHGTAPHHGQKRLAKAFVDLMGARRVLRAASAVLAVSDAEARDLGTTLVVPNGVDAPARARAPRRAGPPRLLYVGNASRQKRAHLLPALLAELPAAELTVVGPTALRPGPRLQVAGVLDDGPLWAALEDADVLVQPGVGEAFGLAAFEAAVLGTPAVAVSGHGAGEWLARAGGTAVAPDDVPALARAVDRLLADEAGARREAASVAAYVEANLRWPVLMPRVDAVYAAARA